MAMLPKMLEHDREQAGWVGRAAWLLGISIREYRELEAGSRSPSLEMWDRICNLFGWPQTFADGVDRGYGLLPDTVSFPSPSPATTDGTAEGGRGVWIETRRK